MNGLPENIGHLIRRCIDGDAQAQKLLYDAHKGRIMGLLRRYTSSVQDAQDILQESFVVVFSSLHSLTHFEKLDGWIKTIAIRTAINHYYHNRKNRDLLSIETETVEDDSLEKIVADIDIHQLLSIVNTLPDGARLVFNLYVVEGYTHPEIAEMLAIAEGTSKSILSRAKESIKKELRKMGITKYTKYA